MRYVSMEPNSSMPKESEIMTEIWSGRDNRWRLCAKKRSRSCFEVWLALTSRGKWEDAVLSVKYCTNSTTIYMLSKNVHYIVIYLITWEQYDYFKRDKFHLLTSYYGNFPEISFRVPLSSLKFLWVLRRTTFMLADKIGRFYWLLTWIYITLAKHR